MAGISQKIEPEEVLPLLARNIVVHGYRDPREREGKPNEFLILLQRYMEQARALQRMAGAGGVLQVSNCAEAVPLLRVIGFRLREGCGADVSFEAVDADQAFLTVDSGFPLAELEEALRAGRPFSFPYTPSRVPLLFTEADWIAAGADRNGNSDQDLVSALLSNAALARLYWAVFRMDHETRVALHRSPGLRALMPHAAVLDFYGHLLSIRNGRVQVPGGESAEQAWANLVGADAGSPSEFITKLIAKDEGWLAAYYDTLARIERARQAVFTQAGRLQRNYEALRGKNITPSPARFVFFRPNPGLLLLFTRLHVGSDGQPHIPGDLQAWKDIVRSSRSRLARDWAGRARDWQNPWQLVEGMVGLSRGRSDEGPLSIFLLLSEVDRGRAPDQRLTPATVRLMADKFARFRRQYLIFSEFSALDNASIARFLNIAESLDGIRDSTLRANALGIFQANVGLWQILARQGQIPASRLNDSWQRVIQPFAASLSAPVLFDAGRASLREMVRDATGSPQISESGLLALLAGPDQADPQDRTVRAEMAFRMRSILVAQRLVSLDTLFSLADGLNDRAQGQPADDAMLALAAELLEFEMPQPLFTTRERAEWSGGRYEVRHTQTQMRTDLRKVLTDPPSPAALTAARGRLVPFLRDALVGINYAYYEPPGAQMLHTNPMFVRSHDFSGQAVLGEHWQTPHLLGRGAAASGGARLVGSLADLPYVLAEVEQDFIVPESVQALIWQDLVPTLLTSATVPRWWGVTRTELRAIHLYQRAGEGLLNAAIQNENRRQQVMDILSDRLLPARAAEVQHALRDGRLDAALSRVMPGEVFYLGVQFRGRFPADMAAAGDAARELDDLANANPNEVGWERLSRLFGVPHPALAKTYSRELISMKPFPAFLGYSSRLLAESWDSSNLYWARLVDEMGYPPSMLNRLIPELTRRMVEKIFASHFEDWPAVLRAMRETGEEFRQGKIAVATRPANSGY
jgi:hypothetical protein